ILHRGRSVHTAREVMGRRRQFVLGAFAVGIMLLAHPERLQHNDDLWSYCAGDEYYGPPRGVTVRSRSVLRLLRRQAEVRHAICRRYPRQLWSRVGVGRSAVVNLNLCTLESFVSLILEFAEKKFQGSLHGLP